MNYKMKSVALLCLGLAFAACSSNDNEGSVTPSSKTRALTQEEFVETGNGFAFNLLRDIAAVNNGQSFVLSPLSITYALGMLNEGARGETQQQIMKVMDFEGVASNVINELCSKIMKEAPQLDESVEINLANGVFLKEPLKLQESYSQCLRQYYDAEVKVLDYLAPASLDYVNDWCSQQTKGMIPHVLDKLTGVCNLINAIYFKADWTHPFDPEATQINAFLKAAGQQVDVPFMQGELKVNYTETAEAQVVSMPFGNEAFRMYVLLPKTDKTPKDVMSVLSNEKMKALNASMQPTDVTMMLPRFTTRTHTELNDILQKMGMTRPFSSMAQLGGMIENVNDGDTYVSRVFQDAAIEVQEKGAKAAAITVVVVDYNAVDLENENKTLFIANHPFVYLITEKSTGAIYFAGVYAGE